MAIIKGPKCPKCSGDSVLKELLYPKAYWWCPVCRDEVHARWDEPKPEHSMEECACCKGRVAHLWWCDVNFPKARRR